MAEAARTHEPQVDAIWQQPGALNELTDVFCSLVKQYGEGGAQSRRTG